jgi:hypothetical protein
VRLSLRILTLKVTVSGSVLVSGDIILPSQMRGGPTLEDTDSIAECLSCLAIAVLSPGLVYEGLLKWFPEALIPFIERAK